MKSLHRMRYYWGIGLLLIIGGLWLVLPLTAADDETNEDSTNSTDQAFAQTPPPQITALLAQTTYLYYFESDDVLLDAATPSKRYSFGALPDEEVTILVYGLDDQVQPQLALYSEEGALLRTGNTETNGYTTWIYQYKARTKSLFFFDVSRMNAASGVVRVMLFKDDPLTGNRTLLDRINPLLPGRAFMVAGEHPDPKIEGLSVAVEVLPVTRFEDVRPEVFASRGTFNIIPALEERLTPVTNRSWRNTPDFPIYTINVRAAPEIMQTQPIEYVSLNLNNFYFFDYYLIIGNGSTPEVLGRGDICQTDPNRPECIRATNEPTGRSADTLPVTTSPQAAAPIVEIEGFALPLIVPVLPADIVIPDVIECAFDPSFFFGEFYGTVGDDSLGGSECSDNIYGDDGDDVLNGGPGFDGLVGGDGNDYLFGGDHDDRLYGGNGNDELNGEDGDDFFDDGDGDNMINGGANDPVMGFNGGDTIHYVNAVGAVTVNLALGTGVRPNGTDTLLDIENINGSNFDDGNPLTTEDTLIGSAVANRIDPWRGNDVVDADAGDDFILDYSGEGVDTIDGGADIDTVNFRGYGVLTINYTGMNASNTNLGDTLTNVENITSDFGNETFNIFLDDENNIFDASGGVDTANYGGAAVTFDVSNVVTASNGIGVDTLFGFENIVGSDAADTVTVNNTSGQVVNINGGIGNDNFTTTPDGIADTLNGGADVDTITGSSGGALYLYYDGPGYGFFNGDYIYNFENFSLGNNGSTTDVVNATDGVVNDFVGGTGVDTLNYFVPQNIFVGYAGNGNGETRNTSAVGALLDTFQNMDNISTSNGTDTFSITVDGNNNTFNGRNGLDTADYSVNAAPIQFNQVNTTTFTVTQGGTDTLLNFETLIGTGNDDIFNITNDSQAHTFNAGAGANDTINIADNTSINMTYQGGGTATWYNSSGYTDTLNNFEIYNLSNTGDYVTFNAIDAQSGTLNGGGGYDYLDVNIAATIDYAGFANGTVTGGTGVVNFTGMDSFYGSTADDTFIVATDVSVNEFNGVAGVDTLISTSIADTQINYYGWNATMNIGGTTDYVYNMENITTDAGNDVFDVLRDFAANTFDANTGTDTLLYNGSNPLINLGANVTITDGAPLDTYQNFETLRFNTSSNEFIIDTDSNTNYILQTNANTIFRFVGSGTGMATIDISSNVPGSDLFDFSGVVGGGININMGETTIAQTVFGTFQLFLRNAINRLTGSNQADNIGGSDGNDTINAGDGNDIVDGGNGDDVIQGQGGDDVVYGGLGNDVVQGGNDNDIVYGGGVCGGAVAPPPGSVILGVPAASSDGSDTVQGDTGNDTLYGGNDNSGAAVANNCNDFGFDTVVDTVGTDTLYGGNNNTGGGAGVDGFDVITTNDFVFPPDTAVADNAGFSGGSSGAFMNTDFFDITYFGNGP